MQITASGAPGNPVVFRNDEQGRRTKAQVSSAADFRPNIAVAGSSPFQVADRAPNLPGGGSATTIYDDLDYHYEVQVRDAQGELMSRTLPIYDPQGFVVEERPILKNLETIIPPEMRAKILEGSGGSVEALRAHLTKLMGGQTGPFSVTYSHNARGQIERMMRRIFNREDIIETTYSEHGDKESQITQGTEIRIDQEQPLSRPELPSYSASSLFLPI